MDPQETWRRLISAWLTSDWSEVAELTEALISWLDKGGFAPKPDYPKNMGADWDCVVVRAASSFASQRASSVLDDPNGIPQNIPFSLSCATCDRDGPGTFADAASLGWHRVQYLPNAISTNFLGICPSCQPDDE